MIELGTRIPSVGPTTHPSNSRPHRTLQVQKVHTRCISSPQLLISLLSESYATEDYEVGYYLAKRITYNLLPAHWPTESLD
jgi:hypothetical protein